VAIAQNPSMETCTHDRGPGTTVCLHCRYEARVAARARRQRLMLRVGATAIIVVTLTAAGVAGASAIRGRGGRSSGANAHAAVRTVDATTSNARESSRGPVVPLPSSKSPSQPSRSAERSADRAPLAPVIPMGQSTIAAGVVAARTDSSVLVSFDAPMLRTRMPVKFESFVRSTLPAIYGPAVDSALVKLADGGIARQGDLLTELPTRGVRIPVRDGWTIALFPETRPGQDGPLVIRYRVVVIKG
jgi:hypothetical protein